MIMFLPSSVVIVYWIVSMYLSPFSHIHIHFCSFTIFYQIQLLVILFDGSSRNYAVCTQFNFCYVGLAQRCYVTVTDQLTSCVFMGFARYKLFSFFQSLLHRLSSCYSAVTKSSSCFCSVAINFYFVSFLFISFHCTSNFLCFTMTSHSFRQLI